MSKILARLALIASSITLAILTLMKGWGLEPQSWFWIIGAGSTPNSTLTFKKTIDLK